MVVERSVIDVVYCDSISEVIMRIWVKNNVRVIVHGLRFPIGGLSELGYTAPKVKSWWVKNNK